MDSDSRNRWVRRTVLVLAVTAVVAIAVASLASPSDASILGPNNVYVSNMTVGTSNRLRAWQNVNKLAVKFTTGTISNASNDTSGLKSVALRLNNTGHFDPTGMRVSLWSASSDGTKPLVELTEFTNPDFNTDISQTGDEDYYFTDSTPYVLQSSTSYFVVIEPPPHVPGATGNTIRLARTTSTGVDSDSLPGWTLNPAIYTPKTDTSWSLTPTTDNRTTKIQLEGTQLPPPTATPTEVGGVEIVLVSNIGQTQTGTGPLGTAFQRAQNFRTGNHSNGYKLTSIEVRYTSMNTDLPTATLHEGSPNATTSAAPVATLMNPSSLIDGNVVFTAPANTFLKSGTDYYILLRGGGSSVSLTNMTGQPVSVDGFTINNVLHYRTQHG